MSFSGKPLHSETTLCATSNNFDEE